MYQGSRRTWGGDSPSLPPLTPSTPPLTYECHQSTRIPLLCFYTSYQLNSPRLSLHIIRTLNVQLHVTNWAMRLSNHNNTLTLVEQLLVLCFFYQISSQIERIQLIRDILSYRNIAQWNLAFKSNAQSCV